MSQLDDVDRVYRELPLEEIPWHFGEPPRPVMDLVESGGVTPCRAVDLGCGAGNTALALARLGFEMTGVDGSATAIAHARRQAEEQGVSASFVVADLLAGLSEIEGPFAFAYDWEVLHHVLPADRENYLDTVRHLLQASGKYLSVAFSEDDPWLGQGKLRRTPLGTLLYFSNRQELEALYAPRFDILALETIEVRGKRGPHMAHYALLQKAPA